METLLSALVGDLASRSISFFVQKCSKHKEPTLEESLHSVQRMLLRVRVVVKEAEGRRITNQGMLERLNILRDVMYKGYYMLDTFKYQARVEEKAGDHEVSSSFALCKFNPTKRLRTSDGSKHSTKEVQRMVDRLNSIVSDMNEFVEFLISYPPIYRQPYSMYLLIDKCMFGRQIEMERILSFLFRSKPSSVDSLGVLAIVGTRGVGKSTLVEHVCIDERVHNHFSRIVLFRESDIKDKMPTALRDGGVTKHQNTPSDGNGKSLVIIELVADIDEDLWKRLYSAFGSYLESDSKIIVTSRSENITKFGTTQAIYLNFLPREAYWYFFKVLVFGSTDPEEHSKLASMAVEICRELDGTFFDANIVADLLRSNSNAQFWCRILIYMKEFVENNTTLFGGPPFNLWTRNKPLCMLRLGRTTECCLLYDFYETGFAQGEVPKITFQEVMFGSATPCGEFGVLTWRSRIPPYYIYMVRCEIQKPQHSMKKFSRKRRI